MQISNVTLRDCSIQDGMFRATVETPATPELEQAMKPKFSMWKPEEKSEFFWIDSEGLIVQDKFWRSPFNFKLRDSGNCFPTRELAEWQAEAEQITRRLNQAAVVYGGRTFFDPDRQNHVASSKHGQWRFNSREEADKFAYAFFDDLTRLAELNKLLTDGWQPFLSVEGKSNG